jgi:uncharacterized protein (TIGR02453 family)
MLQPSTLKFLKDLKKNNNKPWFDGHRADYEGAKSDFSAFIQLIIDRQAKNDPSIGSLKAKDCIFRINRDIRFAKDKTPYKNNMGASINRGGKKSVFGGYYFHCEPGESFVGGGLWMPMPPDLKKLRQEIEYCFPEFKKIIGSKKFKSIYGDLYQGEDSMLGRVPQGFDKDSPAADYLKLKNYIAMRPLKESELTSKDLVKKTIDSFEALRPLLQFINRTLE